MQLVIAVGIDSGGNPVDLYTGRDESAALKAMHDATTAGTVQLAYLFENPVAETTLRATPASERS